jgi:hypothetical protein
VTVWRKKRFLSSKIIQQFARYHSPYKVMNTRNLKIETAGDFWRNKVSPKIRLSGRWLEQAGFKLGHRVTVEIGQPGTLTLRFVDQNNEAGH